MKKFSILLMSVFCFSIVLAGCNFKNFAVPEEVKVKMDATYEFPIASFDSEKNEKLDMSNLFDLEKLLSGTLMFTSTMTDFLSTSSIFFTCQ